MKRLLPLLFVLCSVLPLYAEGDYKGPYALLTSKDGTRIYIAHYDANEIAVLNTADDKIVQTIPVAKRPNGLILSSDGKTLFVTVGAYGGSVIAVDLAEGKVIQEVPAGHTPTGGAATPDGKKLFVCNRFNGTVAEYALPDLKLVKTIKAIREPRGAVCTLDSKTVYVMNELPNDIGNVPENPDAQIDVAAEITAIDVASGNTKNIRLPNGSGSQHGICISPDGRYVYVTKILARFQMPTTQLERGWMNTNGISIIDTTKLDEENGGFVNTVLLDDVDLGAANPWGITTSADGKLLFVAVAGANELIVVDAAAMHKKLDSLSKNDSEGNVGGSSAAAASETPNDLAFLVGMKKRVKLNGVAPRGVAYAPNGSVYLGMYFSDTIQKVAVQNADGQMPAVLKSVEIPLGPKPELTSRRRGEMYWSDATLCFQHWQSCTSCHPDARMDAYNWDLLNDGLGNPKNAKSLLLSMQTAPTMWSGVRDNPDLPDKRKAWPDAGTRIQCVRTGFQFILFTMPDENVCKDIDEYIRTLEPETSPYLVNGKLSEKAERGKKIFEDPKVGCAKCHPASSYFTDLKLHDVNTNCYYDQGRTEFDTPTLVEVWRTAPYLHDGRYIGMKELFTKGEHGDVEGGTVGLTDEQIDDLVEYVLSL